MKEYTITIDIDEDGEIKAETKGTTGDICISELDEILKGLAGDTGIKNKPEFYSSTAKNVNRIANKK